MKDAVIGLFILAPLTAIIRGWALSLLWSWFCVPTFHLPELRIPIALGISTIVGMLVVDTTLQRREADMYKNAFVGVVLALLCVGAGWVYHLFV